MSLFSCPDDEDRAGEGALLAGPGQQLPGFEDGAEVLGEVAADLGVVAQRTDPVPEQVLGNPPLGQGAEGGGGVADHCHLVQVQFGEELGEEGGDRRQGQVGTVGHRRGMRAERQLRDEAAVAAPQAFDDGVPQ